MQILGSYFKNIISVMEYGIFDVGDPFKKYILLVNFKPLIKV